MREAVTVAARPTMISAKYRLKEERRRMLKLSVNKLRRIEDPESSLRRSVLINNTVRRLQREQREARNAASAISVEDTSSMFGEVTMTPLRQEEEATVTTPSMTTATTTTTPVEAASSPNNNNNNNLVLEELEDVLSQFYMPPTPRMITSIDEDDEDDRRGGCSPPRTAPNPSACPVPSKRPRLERLDRVDADDECRALALALADPTNTLEDFKDEVYLRTKPRVPLTACANSPLPCEDALRGGVGTAATDFCGRRYAQCITHTGHDRENIAPLGLGLNCLGLMGADDVAAPGTPVTAANLQHSLQHSLPPYSCSQAHGQAQASQHGLVFHGLMATMES